MTDSTTFGNQHRQSSAFSIIPSITSSHCAFSTGQPVHIARFLRLGVWEMSLGNPRTNTMRPWSTAQRVEVADHPSIFNFTRCREGARPAEAHRLVLAHKLDSGG